MTKFRTISAAFLLTAIAALMCISTARADNRATKLFANGRTISGTLTDANGAVAANEQVKLTKKVPPTGHPEPRKPGQDSTGQQVIGTPDHKMLQRDSLGEQTIGKPVKTDSAGRFTFKDVPAGKYTIVAGIGKTQVRQEIEVTESADPTPVQIKLAAK